MRSFPSAGARLMAYIPRPASPGNTKRGQLYKNQTFSLDTKAVGSSERRFGVQSSVPFLWFPWDSFGRNTALEKIVTGPLSIVSAENRIRFGRYRLPQLSGIYSSLRRARESLDVRDGDYNREIRGGLG